MTGMDYVRAACPVPWWPTPEIDFALWWMWPEVLRRFEEVERGEIDLLTIREAFPDYFDEGGRFRRLDEEPS